MTGPGLDIPRGTPFFQCPRCGKQSYHPDDIRYQYCGNCHDFTVVKPVEMPDTEFISVGRVRIGIAEVPDVGLMMEFYSEGDHDHLTGRFLLPRPAAVAFAEAVADAIDGMLS